MSYDSAISPLPDVARDGGTPGKSGQTATGAALPVSAGQKNKSDVDKKAPVAPVSRNRRVLRTLLPAVLLIGAAFGGHRAWAWHAERKLERFVDALRHSGEPVAPADFAVPPVPDADNAALELREAGEAVVFDGEAWQAFFSAAPITLPLSAAQIDFVREAVSSNRKALAHVSAASRMSAADCSVVLPPSSQPLRAFSFGQRWGGMYRMRSVSLSVLLYGSALASLQSHDQQAAVARVNELLCVARTYGRRSTLGAQSASVAVHDAAFSVVNEIVPQLSVGDGPGQLAAQQAHALLACLLDERETHEMMLLCLRAERARHIAFLRDGEEEREQSRAGIGLNAWNERLAAPWPGSMIERFVSRPVYLGHALNALERFNMAIESFGASSLREFRASIPELPAPRVDANGEQLAEGDSSYVRNIDFSVRKAAEMYYGSLARRRVTALALAVSLYRVEHGRWPEGNLASLVPQYLPSVSEDPFSALADPLVYIPDAARPRVYTIGADGIDDGGGSPADPFAFRLDERRPADWVVDLVRQPRSDDQTRRRG